MLYDIGFDALAPSLDILNRLILFNILSVFLSLIINVIICILLIICMILIYSLLTANIETRTFELGILRALGSKRTDLMTLLLYQSLSYASSYPIGLLVNYKDFKPLNFELFAEPQSKFTQRYLNA